MGSSRKRVFPWVFIDVDEDSDSLKIMSDKNKS